eukprot:gene11455-48675_t
MQEEELEVKEEEWGRPAALGRQRRAELVAACGDLAEWLCGEAHYTYLPALLLDEELAGACVWL